MHPEKGIPHKKSRPFQRKGYHEGDTDEHNFITDDSRYENDEFVINLDKEQEYKEYNKHK